MVKKKRKVKRLSATKRNYDSKWRRESQAYLKKHKWCVHHLKLGRYVRATCVDHKIPHKGNKALMWDKSNWQSLCSSCHSRKTARQDGGFGNSTEKISKECDEKGIPLDANHHWNT